jgi:hypothetical protein
MVRNKMFSMLSLFIVLTLASCSDSIVSKANHEFSEGKKSFSNQYNTANLFAQFPDKLTKDCLQMYSSPPSRRGTKYTGYLYLICPLDKPGTEISNVLNGKALYSSSYKEPENIIVNLSDLRQNVFPEAKCNQWFANKYPIPYFESFDFGLGEKEEQKKVDGETHYNYTYTIPPDLQVYVIASESGNFWKGDYKENRPESLKEWRNGYSRGIATSEKQNMIVYWTMIW